VWQFKPIKKSINWAVWRKTDAPKTSAALPAPPKQSLRRRSTVDGEPAGEERKFNLREKLENVGMEEVVPGGKCEGGHVQKGSYNVTKTGMYALVFGITMLEVPANGLDNTFSVNTSKTVYFILSNRALTRPPLLRDQTADLSSITDSSLATIFSGILFKKRRKKLQGTSHNMTG
jgi:hypothetical protein